MYYEYDTPERGSVYSTDRWFIDPLTVTDFNKVDDVGETIDIVVQRTFTGTASIKLVIEGLQTDYEKDPGTATGQGYELGAGKDCTLTLPSGATAALTGYRETTVTIPFTSSTANKTVTLTLATNKILELPRTAKFRLHDNSKGIIIGDRPKIILTDDRITETIDVTAPGHSLAGLDNTGETNDQTKWQDILDYVSDNSGNFLLYFPDGTYRWRYSEFNYYDENQMITFEGESRTGTSLRRWKDNLVASDFYITIEAVTNKVIVNRTDGFSGLGLGNGKYIFFGNIWQQKNPSTDWGVLEGWTYYISDYDDVGKTFKLKYLGSIDEAILIPPAEDHDQYVTAEALAGLQCDNVQVFYNAYVVGSHNERFLEGYWVGAGADASPVAMINLTVNGNSWNDRSGATDRVAPCNRYEVEQNYEIEFGCSGTARRGKFVFQNMDILNTQSAGIHPYRCSDFDLYNVTFQGGGIEGVACSWNADYASGDNQVIRMNNITSLDDPYYYPPTVVMPGYSEFHVENLLRAITILGNAVQFGRWSVGVDYCNAASSIGLTEVSGRLSSLWVQTGTAVGAVAHTISIAGKDDDSFIADTNSNNWYRAIRARYAGSVYLKNWYCNKPVTLAVGDASTVIELDECHFVGTASHHVNANGSYIYARYYTAPYVDAYYAAGGKVKFTDCVYDAYSGGTDLKIPFIHPTAIDQDVGTVEVDGGTFGSGFTYLLSHTGTGKGGNWTFKNIGPSNFASALPDLFYLIPKPTYRVVLTLEDFEVDAGTTYFFNFANMDNSSTQALTLIFTNVSLHGQAEIRSFYHMTTSNVGVTGYRTITNATPPVNTGNKTDGFIGDVWVAGTDTYILGTGHNTKDLWTPADWSDGSWVKQ